MKKTCFVLSIILFTGGILLGQKYTVSGYIQDAASGEKLIGANVFSKADLTGTVSNSYGFFSISLAPGDYNLSFSYVGYETTDLQVKLNKDVQEVIELKPAVNLEEVVVTANAWNKSVESTQMSSININVQDIKSMPSFLGEVDVIKVIQLLPGVQSGSD